jgi:DNA-binding helix-hairpin-helix protein with protein kinase domain
MYEQSVLSPERLDSLRIVHLERSFGAHLLIFLRKYTILAADIPSAGAELKRRLSRAGVETAADITDKNLSSASFLRSGVADDLLNWRERLEAQYWESSYHGLNAAQQAELTRQYSAEQEVIRDGLMQAEQDLTGLSQEILKEQQYIQQRLNELEARFQLVAPEVVACRKAVGESNLG